jgi:hypothetical protein
LVFTFAFLGLRASLFDRCWPFAMMALLRGAVMRPPARHSRSSRKKPAQTVDAYKHLQM